MKLILALVATSSVIVAPKCAAFTSLSNISKNQARIESRSSGLGPLPAFKFPSPAEKEPAIPTFIDPPNESIVNAVIEPLTDACILALRLSTCALMMHHGLDKIQNVDGFSVNVVAKFFGFLPGAPAFWTLSAAGTQVVGSVLLALGILSRPVAFSMMCTMIVAVVFHLLNTGLEGFPLAVVSQHSYNYELAAMYVGVLAYFSASGAGKFSVDETLLGGEVELYDKVLGKVFNNDSEFEVFEEEEVEESSPFKLPW